MATSQSSQERIAIVGAGIVGLAHAWSAAQRGHAVTLFERSAKASGASIRNFGMIWVIGQRDDAQELAMTARERWLQVGRDAGIWISPCGSIHVAHRPDEWEVLCEFYETLRATRRSENFLLLSRDEVLCRTPGANPDGLLGGLWSSTECCVDPTSATRAIPDWLHSRYGVDVRYSTVVTHVETGKLTIGCGATHAFDRIVICSGDDLATLKPEIYREQRIRRCKLHMMRTVPQPDGWLIGPHVASGLTIRHYPNFQRCSSLGALAERIATETPELDRFGIHVMASQNHLGQVVLGDSHQYDDEVEPFDDSEIDRLIERELRKILKLPTWEMQSRWHGIYAKFTEDIAFEREPEPRVHVCTGLGGNGMTLSMGIAERAWNRWEPNES
jgi:D-hydroxyproline dehydrogenase subunit beta